MACILSMSEDQTDLLCIQQPGCCFRYDTYALPDDLFTEKLELVHGRLAMLGEHDILDVCSQLSAIHHRF